MSDFVPNNRYLQKVLISFFHSKKKAAKAHQELQKCYGDAALSKKCAVIGSVASKTLISILTTVRVKEGEKPLKTRLHALGMF